MGLLGLFIKFIILVLLFLNFAVERPLKWNVPLLTFILYVTYFAIHFFLLYFVGTTILKILIYSIPIFSGLDIGLKCVELFLWKMGGVVFVIVVPALMCSINRIQVIKENTQKLILLKTIVDDKEISLNKMMKVLLPNVVMFFCLVILSLVCFCVFDIMVLNLKSGIYLWVFLSLVFSYLIIDNIFNTDTVALRNLFIKAILRALIGLSYFVLIAYRLYLYGAHSVGLKLEWVEVSVFIMAGFTTFLGTPAIVKELYKNVYIKYEENIIIEEEKLRQKYNRLKEGLKLLAMIVLNLPKVMWNKWNKLDKGQRRRAKGIGLCVVCFYVVGVWSILNINRIAMFRISNAMVIGIARIIVRVINTIVVVVFCAEAIKYLIWNPRNFGEDEEQKYEEDIPEFLKKILKNQQNVSKKIRQTRNIIDREMCIILLLVFMIISATPWEWI